MEKNLLIIVDTDALLALFNPHDIHHKLTYTLFEQLLEADAKIRIPASAISESITALQRKFNKPDLAKQLLDFIKTGDLFIQAVDEDLIAQAADLFNVHGSKKNTFFDAIVLATYKKLHADAIFSYDNWYKKKGATLLKDSI